MPRVTKQFSGRMWSRNSISCFLRPFHYVLTVPYTLIRRTLFCAPYEELDTLFHSLLVKKFNNLLRFLSLPLCIIILSNKARSTATLCSSKNCKRLTRRSNSKLKLNTPPPQHTTTLLSATFHIKNNTF